MQMFKLHSSAVLAAILLLCAVFSSCEIKQQEYEYKNVCHKLVKKQVVTKTINGWGATKEEYYFLYDNDFLEDVDLKTYMKYDVGKTLCWDVAVPK